MAPQPLAGIRRKTSSFLGQLKRRQVLEVGAVYVITGLAAAEAADVFLGNLAPQRMLNLALVLLLAGFPVALMLAWAYSITPSGVKGDRDRGLEYLANGIDDHDFLSLYMRIGLGRGIRSDPRYQALVRKVWPDPK